MSEMETGIQEAGNANGVSSASQDPYHEIVTLHQRLGALLAKLSPQEGEPGHIEPDMDIYENEQEYLIHAALPGISPEEIEIKATPHALTLNASGRGSTPQKSADGKEGKATMTQHRRSRYSPYHHFHFVYTLPSAIVPQSVQAILNHGLLELRLPKMSQEAVSTVTIPVHLWKDQEKMSSAIVSARQESVSASGQQETILLSRSHEGNPAHKMGMAYTPNAGEDHIMQAHSAGVKTLGKGYSHGDEADPIATGQTNPMAVPEEETAAYSKM